MRIIPKTAKVKIEFFRNVSIVDVLLGIVGLALELLIFFTMRLRRRVPRIHREGRNIIVGLTFAIFVLNVLTFIYLPKLHWLCLCCHTKNTQPAATWPEQPHCH